MTICAAVKVRDGLIMATDSMTTITGSDPAGNPSVLKTYRNARKLFRVSNRLIGVMTYGAGNIGERSVEGFLRGFRPAAAANTVQAVAAALLAEVKTAYDAEHASVQQNQRPLLGCYIAGYSKNATFAEEWEFLLPRDAAPVSVRKPNDFGAAWRGIEAPFTRLYHGFDPRVEPKLTALGLTATQVQTALKGFEAPVVYPGMPVQDAIDFAAFILRTTIGMASFEIGAQSCGGSLQIASILPHTGFNWVSEPALMVYDTERR